MTHLVISPAVPTQELLLVYVCSSEKIAPCLTTECECESGVKEQAFWLMEAWKQTDRAPQLTRAHL